MLLEHRFLIVGNLPPDFATTLRAKTEQELYQMLAESEDYFPEAIASAKEELARRNLQLPPPREWSSTSGQYSTAKTRVWDLCGNLALASAALFSLFLFLPILNVFCKNYEPDQLLGSFCLGVPTFIAGHILAFLARSSSSEMAKRKGKRALQLVWGSIVAFVVLVMFLSFVVGLWVSFFR